MLKKSASATVRGARSARHARKARRGQIGFPLRLACLARRFSASSYPLSESVWEAGDMHMELAPRHIVDIAAQGVLDYGERDLLPGNCRK